MGNVRRALAALTVPLVAASAVVCVAPVAPAAEHRDPIGGPQLAGTGVIVNRAAGVTEPPKVKAGSWLIADGDTGEVLAARDPHGHYLPASALKTLTAISLIPKLNPAALVRPTQATCDVEGTKVGMTPKMEYKVSDLFHALLMVSGNDAALALTQAGGGLKPTLAAMNAEAKRLQAYDTLAGSPNGLDVDLGLNIKTQHTSAYDLGLIMRQGLALPAFRSYVGTVNHNWPAPPTKKERKKGKKVGGYPIYSHIRLLPTEQYAYRGIIGGKNGYTEAAGQTFVGAARRDGHTIIIALMKGETLWPSATKMLDWGFANRGKVKPIGSLVGPAGTEKKDTADKKGGPLPENPLTGDESGGSWALTGGGVAGGAVLAVALIMLFRRRSRPAPVAAVTRVAPPPSAEGPPPLQFPEPEEPDDLAPDPSDEPEPVPETNTAWGTLPAPEPAAPAEDPGEKP